MSGSSASATEAPAAVAVPTKTKVERAHSYLALVSTTLGVLGALGTGFVWVSTTFFLGDVHINPDKQVDALTIKVIDKRGQVCNYYGKDVQLMPGKYRLEIMRSDGSGVQNADVNVQLWKVATIPYTVPSQPLKESGDAFAEGNASEAAIGSDQANAAAPDKKHWWQFWKKGQ